LTVGGKVIARAVSLSLEDVDLRWWYARFAWSEPLRWRPFVPADDRWWDGILAREWPVRS
jgi:hypothetical protein